ncbi:MAG: hypothetical protein HY673_02310 [Chloroflexi bacterium]|nr:hypothetical protein [Chloroflexota bacterium]
MSVYSYPAPCSPDLKEPKSVDDCLSQARRLIRRIGPAENVRTSVAPELVVRPGDRDVIVTLPDQDQFVAEAARQALMENGAERVDFLYPVDLVGKNPGVASVEDGWKELELLKEGKASGTMEDLVTGMGLVEATARYLDNHPEYTGVFIDVAGANAGRGLGKHGEKFRGFWPFNTWEWFLSRGHTFPLAVWEEFERRIVEPLGKAAKVRITDPEGTFLEFALSAEEAKRWELAAMVHGHLLMNPLQATAGDVRELRKESLDAPPVFPRVTGCLAGTANHCGFFPRIEAYFENDRLVEVRGGGKYGDGIRALMDETRDLQWPGYPGKGLFWFCDTALCTAVGVHRRRADLFRSYWVYPNLPERTRAGVFHHGFGSRTYATEKEWGIHAKKHRMPQGHIHVHNYFATFEVALRGSNYWHKIIDKGRIAALDEPEVRALAARHGDPDSLLRYDWNPPLPGINCDGNYWEDYAPDPVAYLKKRLKAGQSI